MTRGERSAANSTGGGCEAMMALMIEVLLISTVFGILYAAMGSGRE